MKRIWLSTALFAMIFLMTLSGCGQQAESAPNITLLPTKTVMPTPTPVSTLEPTPIATTTPEPTPRLRSYTTGYPIEEIGVYKPIGIIIENSPAARPQYGLQAADIVYEAPVEGCTRFYCIFNDTLPEKAGPVRSARLYFIRIQQEWDCAFVHFGGPQSGKSNVYTSSSNHIDARIDFIKGAFNDYYWRADDKSAPHNAFTDVSKLTELMEEDADGRTFIYNENPSYTGQTVSNIVLPFYSGEVTYRYEADKNILLRYMGDKEFKDAKTDKAIEVQNLIVQYNNFYHGNEAKGRWLCDQLGNGKADFFIGGKHIEGTWERKNFEDPTIYKDSSGNKIELIPGNTWIAVHPEEKEIIIEY